MSKYDRHACEAQTDEIRIEFSDDIFQDNFTWQLVISRGATESHLENNHYLENVGNPKQNPIFIHSK